MGVLVAKQKQYAKAKSYLTAAKSSLPNGIEAKHNMEMIENYE
jgi:tetratricopeptide repeat protein 8